MRKSKLSIIFLKYCIAALVLCIAPFYKSGIGALRRSYALLGRFLPLFRPQAIAASFFI